MNSYVLTEESGTGTRSQSQCVSAVQQNLETLNQVSILKQALIEVTQHNQEVSKINFSDSNLFV